MPKSVDAAIGACLLARGATATLRALAGLGPAALVRWVEVFHGRGRPFDAPGRVTHGRERGRRCRTCS